MTINENKLGTNGNIRRDVLPAPMTDRDERGGLKPYDRHKELKPTLAYSSMELMLRYSAIYLEVNW